MIMFAFKTIQNLIFDQLVSIFEAVFAKFVLITLTKGN